MLDFFGSSLGELLVTLLLVGWLLPMSIAVFGWIQELAMFMLHFISALCLFGWCFFPTRLRLFFIFWGPLGVFGDCWELAVLLLFVFSSLPLL